MTIFFSFFVAFLAGWVYRESKLSNFWSTLLMAILLGAVFAYFFLKFGCFEPDYFSTGRPDETRRKRNLKKYMGKAGQFFLPLMEDDYLMIQSIAVQLYESIRMVDYVFMLVML